VDPEGNTLIVDGFASSLFEAAAGAGVADLLAAAEDPEAAYAALSVLVLAGMLESDPAPTLPSRPAPTLASRPPVTLVFVCYNGAPGLPGLLRTIRAEDYPALQAVVVDNASTDGSRELLEAAGSPFEAVLLESNRGFAGAFNAGLARASGEWIAILNTDVELAPDAVSAWVARALERPDAGAVAAKMLLASNPRFINSLGNSILPRDWGSDNFMGVLDAGQFDAQQEVFSACFGAALLSRKALEQVGPPDPGYFLYYEDTDWCYRARLGGFPIVVAPRCLVRHQFGGSVGDRPWHFKLRLVARNRMRFTLLNLGGRALGGYLWSYLRLDAQQLARSLIRRQRDDFLAYARAYRDLLLEAPGLLAGRRTRRRLKSPRLAEEDILALNVVPRVHAHAGSEARLTEAVVREWYLAVFPLSPGSGIR